uniref:Uncharacterized protein n=1 Tax=Populus trichocarpa TaxID=3694 RepID=A0A2K1YII7_POPTR
MKSCTSSSQVCHFGLAVFHQGQSNKALELPQTCYGVGQYFLGWEGVGLASFLLIHFWFTRLQVPSLPPAC